MRCVPPQSKSMNLPCRVTDSTGAPIKASGGGLKVFRTVIDPSSTPTTANPVVRERKNSTSACTSGNSGIAHPSTTTSLGTGNWPKATVSKRNRP